MKIYRILSVIVCLMIITCGLSSAINKYNYNLEEIKSFSSIDIVDSFPCPTNCNDPQDMAFGDGFLWLVDEEDELIYKINPSNGNTEGTIPTQGNTPCGLTWANSHLWQSDSYRDGKIYEIDSDTGELVSEFDAYSSVIYSYGLSYDGTYLLNKVIEQLPNYIYKYTIDGEYNSKVRLSLLYTSFMGTSGLAFDGNYIYSCNPTINFIYIHNENGQFCDILQGPGSAPAGLTWDGDYLWCADSGTDIIYKLEITMCQIEFDIEPSNGGEILFDTWYRQYNFSDGVVVTKIAGDYEIAALAFEGYTFDHWNKTGDATIQDSDSNPTIITIFGDCSIKVYFKSDPTNYPPDKPTITGPRTGETKTMYTYEITVTDPDDDLVRCHVDWDGDGKVDYTSSYDISGSTFTLNHIWYDPSVYTIKCQGEDEHNDKSEWTKYTVGISEINEPPNTPDTPFGPTKVYHNDICTYISKTTDPNGDKISYRFNFNGLKTSWTDFVSSGEYISFSREMIKPSFPPFELKVQAKDEDGLKSEWSDILIVDMSEVSTSTVFTSPYDNFECGHLALWTKGDPNVNATANCSGVTGYVGTYAESHSNRTPSGWAQGSAAIGFHIYTGIEKNINIRANLECFHGAFEYTLFDTAGTEKRWAYNMENDDDFYIEIIDPYYDLFDFLEILMFFISIIPIPGLVIGQLINYLATLGYTALMPIMNDLKYEGLLEDIYYDFNFNTLVGNNTVLLTVISYAAGNNMANATVFGCFQSITIDGFAHPRIPIITGPDTGLLDHSYDFTATCNDPNNDQIRYNIDWGDNTETGWTSYKDSGTSLTKSHVYTKPGTYFITIESEDIDKMKSLDKNYHLIKISENQAPSKPSIDGPGSGKKGNSYTYKFTSTDHEGHNVSYYIDWDDGSTTTWTTYQASGTTYTKSHTWSSTGKKTITAKAKDTNGAQSKVATFDVSITRKISKAIDIPFLLQRFFQYFPFLNKILNQII
jgi:hypothetical protein